MSLWPQLNIYNLPVLIAALLDVGFIGLVLFRSPGRLIHRVFLAWNVALVIWNIGAFGVFGALDAQSGLWWSRFCCYGNIWIPATLLHLVLLLCGNTQPFQKWLLRTLYTLGAVLLVLNMAWKGFLVASVTKRFWGYCPIGGVGAPLLDALLVSTGFYCLVLLHQAYKKAFDAKRYQLQYVFWGIVIFYIGGVVNVLMVHGVDIYPFGNLLNIVFCLAVAYAIVSYQWMDIRFVLQQGIVYGSLGTALTLTYVGVVFFIEKTVFANHLNPNWTPRLLALPPTLVIAPAFKVRLQPWIERHLFSAGEASRQSLGELGPRFCSSLDISTIAKDAVEEIRRILDLKGSAFLLLDPSHSSFTREAVSGTFPIHSHMTMRELNPEWFSGLYASIVVTREIEWRRRTQGPTSVPLAMLEDWLHENDVSILLPVRFQKALLGVWLLGLPESSKPLAIGQHRILEQVASQLGLAVHNALAVQQLEAQQKLLHSSRDMVVMGTLATEMAHELSKPLTHIMNAGSRLGSSVKGLPVENLKTIEREAQRAAEILDGFAMLSPERTLHRMAVSLADLVEEAISTLGIEEDSAIHIIRGYGPLPPVYVNPGQIVQIFTNLIQNAWQAMPQGGSLAILIDSAAGSERPAMIKVSITDTGVGIPLENQKKVFEPFFTTKESSGGRGMGLSISLAMAQRHGGTVRIESPVDHGRGTRVTLALPIIQKKEIADDA